MNVGEVEKRLEMTRANIRFYEKEGLLRPARGENAYRDYSEEDIKALEKIKLLRQLHLDLDAIRRVQAGELSLTAAVEGQLERLRCERADLEWAERICRDLTATGVDYAALDARPYLERLARPADEPGYFALRRDELSTVPHPWRRYFARWLDLFLYGTLWTAFQMLVLRWNPESNLLIRLLDAYIGYGLMLLLEPILLSTWGYTPGKWLLGLMVRDVEGNKLSLGAAWTRTMGVFGQGCGYGIPIYNLVRMWKSRVVCLREEPLDWEEGSYRMKDEKGWRCGAVVGAAAANFGLILLIVLQAAMPIHRGNLTAAQYADNINSATRFYNLMEYWRMDETGRWVDDTPSGTFYLDVSGGEMPDHQLILTDGVVTGVRLEVVITQPEFVVAPDTAQKQLAAIALAAAQRSYTCITWPNQGVLRAIEQGGFESYTLQAGDMTITNQVEIRGFGPAGSYLFPKEGEESYYHMVFTIEKDA